MGYIVTSKITNQLKCFKPDSSYVPYAQLFPNNDSNGDIVAQEKANLIMGEVNRG